jgi:hypothetical protein
MKEARVSAICNNYLLILTIGKPENWIDDAAILLQLIERKKPQKGTSSEKRFPRSSFCPWRLCAFARNCIHAKSPSRKQRDY